MKKNKYNLPRHATNSNNTIYNQYVEDMFYADDYNGNPAGDEGEHTPRWKKNGRYDIYHTPMTIPICTRMLQPLHSTI